jgi:hypothetical protein
MHFVGFIAARHSYCSGPDLSSASSLMLTARLLYVLRDRRPYQQYHLGICQKCGLEISTSFTRFCESEAQESSELLSPPGNFDAS